MKIYLTGQNNFGNRGCEALVRSTVDVVRARLPRAEILVPSLRPELDARQWPDAAAAGARIVPLPPIARRFTHWGRVAGRWSGLAAWPWPRLGADDPLGPDLAGCDAVLSIGGDNYSLDYDLGSLAYFVAVAEAALQRGKPVLLWGASVGPFDRLPAVERHMAAHLARLNAVTVRESHSGRYLAGLGLGDRVHAVADSAFLLRPQPFDLAPLLPPAGEGLLGLNLSPLIDAVRRRHGAATPLLDEAVRWLHELLQRTTVGVLLVPHVAPLDGAPRNNDEQFLAGLLQAVGESGGRLRVLPSGLNAAQLKHAIAQCRWFVGARTHATIAAMSSGVPTLSIAYSVKARGINLDLFGHERYVLDTRTLDAAQLAAGLATLRTEEAAIRALYAERLPVWRERAGAGGALLQQALAGAAAARAA